MYKKYGIIGLKFNMDLKENKNKTIDEKLKELTSAEKDDIIKIYDTFIKENGLTIKKGPFRDIKNKSKCSAVSNHKLLKFFNISESSFYYKEKNENERNRRYENKKKIVFDTFYATGCCMGARKLTVVIKRKYDIKISNKSVQYFMNFLHLKPCVFRRKRIDPKNTKIGFKNIIKRKFNPIAPNEIYTTDITYIHSAYATKGFYYLSFFIDCFNNEIIGATISENPNTKLVMKSTKSLVLKPGTILHQDHGCQYTSREYIDFINKNNLIGSMSRVGNSLDNRPSEYTNGRIKLECINKIKSKNRKMKNIMCELKKYIFNYNNYRIQSTLNDLSPIEYKIKYLKTLRLPYNLERNTPV
ncbi:MAG: IS3 family transposase [Bacteroidales bacterium]|jgi:transposase InsO family protein|nr:IS3 family transposase [Bacteroidales bacterium]